MSHTEIWARYLEAAAWFARHREEGTFTLSLPRAVADIIERDPEAFVRQIKSTRALDDWAGGPKGHA